MSKANDEQRRGESAVVAGEGWRVRDRQLLSQTPGTTPPHTPLHKATTVFERAISKPLCLLNNCVFSSLFIKLVPLQKYPPGKKLVRAVSILTGYLIQATGPNSCKFTYLSQADPKGEPATCADAVTLLLNIFYFFFKSCFYKTFLSLSSGSLPKVVVNAATKMLAPKVCEANTSVVINSFNRAFCLHLQSSAAFESDELKNTQTISVGRVCIHEAI